MRPGAPWNWYKFNARYSLELLETFARRTETQIENAIGHFKQNKQTEFHVISEEERIGQDVDHYDGLESMTWNLNDLFESHFPNLQRKSAFITLYSFLENELEKLANSLRREISHEGKVDDISGNGIFQSYTYMKLIIALDVTKDAVEWQRLNDINKVRNIIVHAEGELSQDTNQRAKQQQLVKRLKGHLSINADNELFLNPTFLSYVLKCFDEFFQYLARSINNKFPTKESRKGPPKEIKPTPPDSTSD